MESYDDAKYEKKLSELVSDNSISLIVDFHDLYSFDEKLADELINNSKQVLSRFADAAFFKLSTRNREYANKIKYINIRVRNLIIEVPLRNIGAHHIGKLIMVSGIIVRATNVYPYIIKAIYKCESCGEELVIEQDGFTLSTPQECASCNNRRSNSFNLLPDKCTYIDSQRITIQERPEELPAGQLPQQITIELKDDIVNIARPGDRISIVGKLNLIKKRSLQAGGGTSRQFSFIVDANNIDVSGKELELLEITDEDIEKIKEASKDPWLMRNMIQSIAPFIHGYDTVKKAILFFLFGGVRKELQSVALRGDINVLLIGDPGTGKSQMLQYAAMVAPRGLFTTGRGSSAAGLTAAVVKEKDGGFILEAGALVLADNGICCIDEMDKMRDEDRGAIHPTMEQQIVSIAKGGIVATMNARTSILASANPTLGRYNSYVSVIENIKTFPVTLLNRFDLIFILQDTPNLEKDDQISTHILDTHDQEITLDPTFDPKFLRKYISYSQRIKPNIGKEAKILFKEFYGKMRMASRETKTASISISARQLESLVRIAEARARIYLRDNVTEEDAEVAISIMNSSLEQVSIDPTTGEVDIDIIYSGKPRSLQVQLQKVLGAITDYNMHTGEPMRDEDLFDCMMNDHSIGRTEVARLIGILMRDGTIFAPRAGMYKKTN